MRAAHGPRGAEAQCAGILLQGALRRTLGIQVPCAPKL